MNRLKKEAHWLAVILAILLNYSLSALSWEEIRIHLGWVKNIPQQTNFKLRHIIQFAPQVWIWTYCIRKSFAVRLQHAVIFAWLAVTLNGAAEEIHQAFVPSRICALRDVLWDSLGALVGLVTCVVFKRLTSKI